MKERLTVASNPFYIFYKFSLDILPPNYLLGLKFKQDSFFFLNAFPMLHFWETIKWYDANYTKSNNWWQFTSS